MSFAPDSLLRARSYLLEQLDMDPGDRPADLQPEEVGIIGNLATHFSGYHLGWDRIKVNLGRQDYSVAESSRDADPTNAAMALDIGLFDRTVGGRRLTLPHLSMWLVTQARAGAADTRDIREIIYSLDGETVKRWDRLGIRTSGDDTHLTHTHISYFRDSENRDKTGLFRRYIEGDKMDKEDVGVLWNTDGVLRAPDSALREDSDNRHWAPASFLRSIRDAVRPKVTSGWKAFWPDEGPNVSAGFAAIRAVVYSRRAADNTAKLPAEIAALRGEVAGLTELVRQLLAAPPIPLTSEQLADVTRAVTAAARESAERSAAPPPTVPADEADDDTTRSDP